MEKFQKLLDSGSPFVENLLRDHGEFFPLAYALDRDGAVASVSFEPDEEQPLSDKLIARLKAGLKASANEWDLKTITIFYNARITDSETKVKSDAIAVFMEDADDDISYHFYYTYKLENDILNLGNSWREEAKKENFVKED